MTGKLILSAIDGDKALNCMFPMNALRKPIELESLPTLSMFNLSLRISSTTLGTSAFSDATKSQQ